MITLKKTALAMLALGSSAVFAGTMGPVCTPGNVTVPCEGTAYDVGIQALYLKPSYDADFGYLGSRTNNNVTVWQDFDPDSAWGFRLEGSYHFSTGNDLNVNWLYYSNGNNYRGVADGESWNIKPTFNAVNIEMGQHVDFGERKNIRFHGGVQYMSLKHGVTNRLNNVINYHANAKFNGFGPRAGADMSYDLANGFSVYGTTAAALLVGKSKFDISNNVTGVRGEKTAMVPELEAKLGAKYNYMMAEGTLSLDAGWMFVNYFNAQHAVVAGFAAETDFALNGPYIGLKYVGNV